MTLVRTILKNIYYTIEETDTIVETYTLENYIYTIHYSIHTIGPVVEVYCDPNSERPRC